MFENTEQRQETLLNKLNKGQIDHPQITCMNSLMLAEAIGPHKLSQELGQSELMRPLLLYNSASGPYFVSFPIEVKPYKSLGERRFMQYLKVTYSSAHGLICPPRFKADHGEFTRIFLYVSPDRHIHLDENDPAKIAWRHDLEDIFREGVDPEEVAALNYSPALADIPF
ncbi:hypothetical protein KY362_01015, partial [Candidatus Woesearchaeota archaeon]|nr:hypothetical protein [Candidatus Woesearchaeota archaeon]